MREMEKKPFLAEDSRMPETDDMFVSDADMMEIEEEAADQKDEVVEEDDAQQMLATSLIAEYLRDIGKYDNLTVEEEQKYGRMLKTGTPEEKRMAKHKLVEHNLRYVVTIAKKYAHDNYPIEDAIQDGNLGLMRAADKFDADLGYRFTTYATAWIKQSITRAIADSGRTIRLPVHMQEKINKIRKLEKEAEMEGKALSYDDIAGKLDMTKDEIREVMRIRENVISLDAPVKGAEDSESFMIDFVAASDEHNPEHIAIQTEMQKDVLEAVEKYLDSRSAEVIKYRFGIGGCPRLTLEEVGKKYHLTRERIRQIEVKSLRKLRNPKYARKLREYVTETPEMRKLAAYYDPAERVHEKKEVVV